MSDLKAYIRWGHENRELVDAAFKSFKQQQPDFYPCSDNCLLIRELMVELWEEYGEEWVPSTDDFQIMYEVLREDMFPRPKRRVIKRTPGASARYGARRVDGWQQFIGKLWALEDTRSAPVVNRSK